MKQTLRWFSSPQFYVVLIAFVLGVSAVLHYMGAPASKSELQHDSSPTGRATLPTTALNCSATPCLALTFDDGPNPIATPIVLQALEQAHAHATFFVVGSRAATMPYLLQQMNRDGDEIGDHSWSHPDMTKLSAAEVDQQVAQTQAAVTSAGIPAPTLFRPPDGFVNATMQQQIHMPFIMWDDDSKDWTNRNPAQIIPIVEAEARPGAIVELHDIYTSTGQALPQLLPYLQARYQLVTVSQLLNLRTGQTGEFYGR